jgi:hypothetical protein
MMPDEATKHVSLVSEPGKEAWSDLSLANMIAQAACQVPGVDQVNGGRLALAATYGPGGRVPGVILRREEPDRLLIEVHIVGSATVLVAAFQQNPANASARPPVLLQLAEQVRTAVQQVLHRLNLLPLAIDVVIEDIV